MSASPDGRRAVLWSLALVWVGLALRPAWAWVQETWYEMNYAAPTWADRGWWAVKEVGSLALALGLMTVLWKTVGPPFAPPRDRRSASTEGEPEATDSRPQWKTFESRAEVERRADPVTLALRRGGEWLWTVLRTAWLAAPAWAVRWRSFLWAVVVLALIGASGWALLCVACAVSGPGYLFIGYDNFQLLVIGIAPLAAVLVLALVVWALAGPPFVKDKAR